MVYLKHPGQDFGDKLDGNLERMREEADGGAKKITRYIRSKLLSTE